MNCNFHFKPITLRSLPRTKLYRVEAAHLGSACKLWYKNKRFASVLSIFSCLSVKRREKLFVGFVYSPLKSVGNSCYSGRFQALCDFLAAALGELCFHLRKHLLLLQSPASTHRSLLPPPCLLLSLLLSTRVLLKCPVSPYGTHRSFPNAIFSLVFNKEYWQSSQQKRWGSTSGLAPKPYLWRVWMRGGW